MRQHRLFTGVYVVGTGLSIALVMTIFIIFYVKFAPVYPEYNRDRTLVIKSIKRSPKGSDAQWNANAGVSYEMIKDLLPGLPHVEAVGGGIPAVYDLLQHRVTLPNKEQYAVAPHYTDAGFWRVFTFRFLHGKPFTQADVESEMPVAVISEGLAQRLFATDRATGMRFLYDGRELRVVGVVEDVSNATPEASGDLWLPLAQSGWVNLTMRGSLLGNIRAYILVDDAKCKDEVVHSVQEMVRQYSLQDKEYNYTLMGQPDDYAASTFRQSPSTAPDMGGIFKQFAFILLALLFIPALNLSGMISSRMNQRLFELGIRKAYGATKRQLLNQVLCENLVLTLLGGIAGLLISYFIVLGTSDWILTIFDENLDNAAKNATLTVEMLFNPAVFGTAFALCVVLNVISALIPAVSALRHPIVNSLNDNR